jgi:orotate phosphoribosyltransferase
MLGFEMGDVASEVAGALYRSGCLKFGSFKIKSGVLSPYYIDLACLLSSPKDLCALANVAAGEIGRLTVSERIDKLASIELKGALLLPSIACRVNLPCIVVRKEEKTYGATGRIAGAEVVKGESILFFDDVVSEGLSKVEGIKPLEELGAKVRHVMIVVDREQGGRENLEKLGYKVHALAKISELVDRLLQSNLISKEQAHAVLDYIKKLKEEDTQSV